MRKSFEWDESKRLSNIEKHGTDFNRARLVFDGRAIINVQSNHFAEDRILTTGMLENRFITVVWTDRNGTIRIVSARRARNGEQNRYRAVHGG